MTKDSTQVASFVCCLTEILGIKLSKQLIERDKSSASLFPHLSFFSTSLLLGRGGRPDHATGVVTKVMQSHLTLVPVERQTQTTKMNVAFTKFFGLGFILLFYSVAFASESINPGKVADSELISKDRIHAGKSKMEEFTTNAKSSDCWRKAVEGIKVANRVKGRQQAVREGRVEDPSIKKCASSSLASFSGKKEGVSYPWMGLE